MVNLYQLHCVRDVWGCSHSAALCGSERMFPEMIRLQRSDLMNGLTPLRVNDMAQLVKALATKSDFLSWIPGAPHGGRGN